MTEKSKQAFFPGFEGSEHKTPSESANRQSSVPQTKAIDPEHSGSTRAGFETVQDQAVSTEINISAFTSREMIEPSPASITNPQEPLVVLVDCHALIYQVFHAMPPMTNSKGVPVGAVHGFLRDIAELKTKYKPDYLFCAFDKSEDTFRNELYPQYKGHREEMPDDLRTQIPLIHHALEALRIPILELAGFEADDLLATVAEQAYQRGARCYLVTSDKDCRQLINDRIQMLNLRTNELFGAEQLRTVWGIRPDQVVDFQSMVGDSVDNVPGIPLIGPKLAQQLLEQFDTLEGVFANVDKVKGDKRRENIEKFKDQALVSRKLVELCRSAPIEINWEAAKPQSPDQKTLADLFQDWGFRRLASRFLGSDAESMWGSEPQENRAPNSSGSESNNRSNNAFPAEESTEATRRYTDPEWKANYVLIDSEEALDRLVERLATVGRISFDTETTSTRARSAEPVGYAICWAEGESVYIPVRAPLGEVALDLELVNQKLKPILENEAIEKVGQNIKYDWIVMQSQGITLRGIVCDTLVADYLLDPGQRSHNLDDMAKRLFDYETIKISELIGTGKNQRTMDQVSIHQVTPYAAEDADVAFRLSQVLLDRMDAAGLRSLFRELEVPLVEVLAEMEFHGIQIDVDRLKQLSIRFEKRIADLLHRIEEIAGSGFNPDSPKQLAKVLFEQLKLPVIKRTKTGASTDAEVLQELAPLHALPATIIEYRQATKLKSTYIDALPALVCAKSGRIHTSFRQDVAATGRLSSSEPNLQNIPIRTEEGREIRSAFRAGIDNWVLLTADYSQIELRVLAHYCGDASLRNAFETDQDIHRQVAAEVYGVAPQDVTSAMRRSAKAINFGIIYGQSAFGLAKSLQIPKQEAATFIEAYFAKYPGVQSFMFNTLEGCRVNGYVSTMSGRRRILQGIRDFASLPIEKRRTLTEPERMAVNTVIQGSAADLIKMAMLRVAKNLRSSRLKATMLLQIHDELVFEVAPEDRDELARLVVDAMTNVVSLSVPLKVDVKSGKTWADCEPLE